MSRPLHLTQWQHHLSTRFPDLPTPVVAVLALYSFGLLLAQVSGLTTITYFLAKHLGRPADALRKRLSEFYKEAAAKSGVHQGQKRRDFDVATCFAPLLRWALSLWSGRHLALAIDVTNLADRFHVLCVSVVVGGVGIPVAWKVLRGGVKDPWAPYWQKLLALLKTAVPADWTVIVLSDRGLESADLFRFIKDLNWHPLMRVKKGGKFRPTGWHTFHYFHQLVRQVDASFYAEGLAYAGEQLPSTLLGFWAAGHEEPWLLLTDLPPEAGHAVWYAFRSWIEQGFKVIKGGGWEWQYTRMDDPGRVERLWLVLAVATLWVVALGAADEAQEKIREELKGLERRLTETQQQAQARLERERLRLEKQRAAQQAQKQARQAQKQAKKPAAAPTASAPKKGQEKAPGGATAKRRALRLSLRGLAVLKAAWDQGQNPLPQHLHPEPWPEPCHSPTTLTEQDFLYQQT